MAFSNYTTRRRAFRLQRLQLGQLRRQRAKSKFVLPDFRTTMNSTSAGIRRLLGMKGGNSFHVKHSGLPKL